ncbi:hypothetical protein [Rheinheimera maricola]|uniref:Uncharacterized protein n=1 Tax=Rheinheimera maricola TaxID=2793282 RepID=A0ABS7XCR6_9GAMM|nr:hypothetical protein [Rheinheimera maricola]MBZ9613345.1 hypothetical protein [Rheinheimera maricola]
MIKISSLSTAVSLLFATTAAMATTLPPILDAYPRCDYKITQQISTVSRLGSTESDADHKHEQVLTSALSELREKAAGKGDAVILQKVTGQLSRDRATFTQSRLETEILYRLEADVIELCVEDSAKPLQLTRYNAQGKRQLETAPVKMQISATIVPRMAQQHTGIDNGDIGFTSGYHGIRLGSSRQQAEALFGQPDSFYLHENNDFVLSYGNQLWLTFSDDKLIKAGHTSEALAYPLTKQLSADRHAKLANWLLDDRFSKRSLLDDIKAHYQTQLQQLSATEFMLQHQQTVIRLSFNQYFDIKSAQQQIKLAEVSVANAAAASLPALQLPTLKQLGALAQHPAAAPLQHAGWAKLFSQLAVPHYSTIQQQKRLQLYRPELAAVFSDNGLSEVQLALLTQDASLKALQHLLSLFSLPTTRQHFMAQHPDAFETVGQLVVYDDQLEINATFADNDNIDSLVLKWF